MTQDKRQRTLLVLLALVVVIFAWRVVIGRQPTSTGASARSDGREPSSSAGLQVETLRLADLVLEPGEFHIGRDPFRFAAKPPPPPPPRAPQQQAPQRQRRPQPRRQAAAPGPTPPPVDVRYLGRFGPVEGPIAVFSDGREIFNVRQGGVLKEHFLVDKIGYESADLKFVDFPDAPAQRLAVGGKS